MRLSQITGMDVAINYWGSPWIAHPIVSFQFADALPLCFSIETRKTIGQKFHVGRSLSAYTLIYVVADERDCIRLRTNYRREDVYLYHTLASPTQARERFREYINTSTLCTSMRVGTTLLRATAPQAFAPSGRLNYVHHGIGAFS